MKLDEPSILSAVKNKSSKLPLLRDCSIEDVKAILNSLGLSKYLPQFVENGINGSVLVEINSADDLKECGIAMPGPILRSFFNTIKEYKRNGVPQSVLSMSSK